MIEGKVLQEMINYFGNDVRRIAHTLKVVSYARTIAMKEDLTKKQIEIVELTAILHDIGIPNSVIKYNSSDGKYQEIEGPAVAKKILEKFLLPQKTIERICFIIGNHHSYKNIDGIDYQIIIEADFFVNAEEENISKKAITHMRDTWFKTKTGTQLLTQMFL